MADLDIEMSIWLPTGSLVITDYPYDLEAGTRSEVATTWRRKKVTNEHVEGSFDISAHRENAVETVNVYVEGTTTSARRAAVEALKAAFDQLQYTITLRIQDSIENWTCQAADYTERTEHMFHHAGLTLVAARVPRRPTVVYSEQ